MAVQTQRRQVAVQYNITDSDLELITLLCLPAKVIGKHLGLEHATVRTRIKRLSGKLMVENRASIIVKALELNLVTLNQLVYRRYDGTEL